MHTAEEMLGLRTSQHVYFYFKLNGLYGKGYVVNLAYVPEIGLRECALDFYLQPDGSTNVETTSS